LTIANNVTTGSGRRYVSPDGAEMSLPAVRILTGAQPIAAHGADNFLVHFAPYFVLALTTVAVAGAGTYTFTAYALAFSCFWVHVVASGRAVLRRSRRRYVE
jgi:cellulose synthase (UDP-forming)